MKKLIVIAFSAALALACGEDPSISQDEGLELIDVAQPKFADANTLPFVEGDADCVTQTISIPINDDANGYGSGIGLAPSTPAPNDVYVCGTVEGVDLYPANDCVLRNGNRVGNFIDVTYTLRIGYVYTVSVYYAGWMRVDNIQVTSGASGPITLNGFIWRGGYETAGGNYGGTVTYPNGRGLYGQAYACFRVDRQSNGTIVVSQFNVAPCNVVIGSALISTGDSTLSITSGTDVRFQTS
ncbi:hypothetical protein IT409_01340, partial [Candidatus Falkowbacteria bacterium]|nr:hypothetical protein [Candidatus Falkowbacteria bacterium]